MIAIYDFHSEDDDGDVGIPSKFLQLLGFDNGRTDLTFKTETCVFCSSNYGNEDFLVMMRKLFMLVSTIYVVENHNDDDMSCFHQLPVCSSYYGDEDFF